MAKPIVIVGAGLAGLTCAKHLHRQGREFVILDASDRLGGRLKTDAIGGYRFDRGFQVHFTAYPAALAELDSRALELNRFAHGAYIWWNNKLHRLDRDDPVEAAFCKVFGLGDKLRMRSLSAELADKSTSEIWHEEETTTETFLRRYGFTDAYIDRFARPFFGGVFLDRSLSTSSRMFQFIWKMIDEGEVTIPRLGMEAIPQQIASNIPAERFRMNTTVTELVKSAGAVTGVKLASGEILDAEHVVVATESFAASKLTGCPTPIGSRGTICMYFEVPHQLVYGNFIILNGTGKGLINMVVPVTNICPDAAPAGKFVVSVNIIGGSDKDDSGLLHEIQDELRSWPAEWRPEDWKLLQTYRLAHAQFPQGIGVLDSLSSESGVPGLSLAGDYTRQSSINGALESGAAAAYGLMQAKRETVPA